MADLSSCDEAVRADGVRSLCPCHAGWEVFEQNVSVVFRYLKDPSRAVRADALHVFEDAARMQIAEDLRYYVEAGETKIGEKRASARYRSIQDQLEARRDRKIKRNKETSHRKHGFPGNLQVRKGACPCSQNTLATDKPDRTDQINGF